jgi:hypothetical protein
MEVQGVVLFFEHGYPKKNEGPSNGKAVGCLPFAPDTKESTPGLLGQCHNPSFGLVTKAKGLQGYGPREREEARESKQKH